MPSGTGNKQGPFRLTFFCILTTGSGENNIESELIFLLKNIKSVPVLVFRLFFVFHTPSGDYVKKRRSENQFPFRLARFRSVPPLSTLSARFPTLSTFVCVHFTSLSHLLFLFFPCVFFLHALHRRLPSFSASATSPFPCLASSAVLRAPCLPWP